MAKVIPPGQDWLLRRMKSLGYDIDFNGMCFGISSMIVQANILNDLPTLKSRLEKMAAIDEVDFRSTVEALPVQEKTDIYAFCDGIVLFQQSVLYKNSIFEDSNTTLRQIQRAPSSLLRPVQLNELAASKAIHGAYSTEELGTYLHSLRNHLGKDNFSTQLLSINHAVFLSYDAEKKEWLYIDPNHMPGKSFGLDNEKGLVSEIQNGFSSELNNKPTVFSSIILATKETFEKHLSKHIQTLVSSEAWQNIHPVNKNRFTQTDENLGNLLKLHAEFGDITALSQLENMNEEDWVSCIKKTIINDDEPSTKFILNQLELKNKATAFDLLNIACKKGSINSLELLIKKVNPTIIKKNQISLMSAAIESSNPAILNRLLEHGVSRQWLTKANQFGHTPLMLACFNGSKSMVRTLLTHLTNNDIKKEPAGYPLKFAIISGHSELVKMLLNDERFTNNLGLKDEEGNNLFLTTCARSSVPTLSILLNDERFKSQLHEHNNKDQTALMQACKSGRVEMVEALLAIKEFNQEIHHKDKDGLSALDHACINGHLDVIKTLLKEDNQADTQSAFIKACENGHLNIATYLYHQQANDKSMLFQSNKEMDSVIFAAFENPELLEWMLNRPEVNEVILSQVNLQNESILTAALKHKNAAELTSILLRQPNLPDKLLQEIDSDGNTILMRVQKLGLENEALELLTQKEIRATANHINHAGENAIGLALSQSNDDIIMTLLSMVEVVTKLTPENIVAIANYANKDLAEQILYSCPEDYFFTKTNLGENALHLACQNNDINAINKLININPNGKKLVNERDELGKTPIFKLFDDHNIDAITANINLNLLLQTGANVKEFNQNGESLLHLATGYSNPAVIETLLEHGADLNAVNKEGKSPLHLAVEHGNIKAVQCLLAQGAEINLQDYHGNTPLMLAAKHYNTAMIQLLSDNGANHQLRNLEGKTALYHAVDEQNATSEINKREIQQGFKEDRNTIEITVRNQQYNAITCLINNGSRIHPQHPKEQSVLTLARTACKIIKQLIQKSAKAEHHYLKKKDKYLKATSGDTAEERAKALIERYRKQFPRSKNADELAEKLASANKDEIKALLKSYRTENDPAKKMKDRLQRHIKAAEDILNEEQSDKSPSLK